MSLVQQVVRAAGRRRLLTDCARQCGYFAATLFSMASALVLAGTQILHWYWLVLLPAAAASAVLWQVARNRWDPYRVAQALDVHFKLPDLLSTAWYLQTTSGGLQMPFAAAQIHDAERAASAVSSSQAFPFKPGRSWLIACLCAALFCGLFVTRYLVTASLSLRPSMLPLFLGESPASALEAVQRYPRDPKLQDARQKQPALAASAKQNGRADAQLPDQRTLAQADDNAAAKSSRNSEPHPGGKDDAAPEGAAQTSGEGMLDRMKDALSGLMNKLKPDSGARGKGESQQATDAQDKRDQSGDQQGRPGQDPKAQSQTQNPQNGAQKIGADSHAKTREGSAGMGETADGKPESKGNSAQSGAGRNDGSREIMDAEQLKALGKMAEIIGKRAAKITGDMSIEAPGGPQHLQTQYSGRTGRHAEAGTVSSYDDIQYEDREYVREYMRAMHRLTEKQQ